MYSWLFSERFIVENVISEEASWKVAWWTEHFSLWLLKCSVHHATLQEVKPGQYFLLWYWPTSSLKTDFKYTIICPNMTNTYNIHANICWILMHLIQCCLIPGSLKSHGNKFTTKNPIQIVPATSPPNFVWIPTTSVSTSHGCT